MKNYSVLIPRIILGLLLSAFGLMGLFKVMPDPHSFWASQDGFSSGAKQLILALWDSGFMMMSVCLVHLFAGLQLVSNKYVPLAIAIHLPVSVLMLLFHLVLDPATGGMAYLTFALNAYLIYRYRSYFSGLFTAISHPS